MCKNDPMSIIRRANKCYEAQDYDGYEKALDDGARVTGKPRWQFEDDVTDVRLFGEEGTG